MNAFREPHGSCFRFRFLAPLAFGLAALPAAAGLVPLAGGPAGTGQGLSGSWYKVDDSARFSNHVYQGQAIKDYGWGTGIWSVGDIAQIQASGSPLVQKTAQTVSAVSFANDIYNSTAQSGNYGSWNLDYARAVAPVVGPGTSDCPTAPEAASCDQWNYAAVFTGYLYIAAAGFYDLGIFADDGFSFSLHGAGGATWSMVKDSVAGGSGRSSHSLADTLGMGSGLELGAGFYGIDLSYYNRLQSGVLDFGIKSRDGFWQTVGEEQLFAELPHAVPEPETAGLLLAGMAGLWLSRRRQRVPGKAVA